MKIKVTTPEEKNSKKNDVLLSLIKKFEKELKDQADGFKTYDLFIDGCYNEDILRQVEDLYKQAGWRTATCEEHHSFRVTYLKLEK